ncbi:DUF4230 domain-containing protein [Myroides sp. C15-4]|uniref:DUF4230 domain-containing protein n=1 Tax=Myroides sp. C15-4 TaxID=3400532 RepID=UPI003D2F6470
MRQVFKVVFLFFIMLFFMFMGVVVYQYFAGKSTSKIEYNSDLIQEQLKNVSKLIVTEANYTQVMTYEDQQKYLLNLVSFTKKAVVIVNAKATVEYDLSQLQYQIDEEHKVVQLLHIPEPEVHIYPDYKLYDVETSTFNPFTGSDYNKINAKIKEDLQRKIEQSSLKSNAENRLTSELGKLLVVTNMMGWRLEYQGNTIKKESDLSATFLP